MAIGEGGALLTQSPPPASDPPVLSFDFACCLIRPLRPSCGVEQVLLYLFSIEIPQAGRLFRSVTSPGLATSLNTMVSERLTSWGSLQVTRGRLFSPSLPCGLLEIIFTFWPCPLDQCSLVVFYTFCHSHTHNRMSFSWLFMLQCCFRKACSSRIAVPSRPVF